MSQRRACSLGRRRRHYIHYYLPIYQHTYTYVYRHTVYIHVYIHTRIQAVVAAVGCGRVVQWDPAVVGGNSYRVLVDGRSVPTLCRREEATRLTGGDPFELPGFGVATLSYENAEGKVFDVASAWTGDVVPVAAFAFKDRGEDERRVTGETGQLRSLLKRSVAVRGLIVGLLQAEDRMREHRDAHPEPNLDMQFVGVEGYAYP